MPTPLSAEDKERDEHRWSDLMARGQRGDRAAYERLLTEVAKVIETYIRVRFGRLQALEDCVQDCLLALHKARHTYDPARPFRPWMFTIVRHKTIDALRRIQTQIVLSESLRAEPQSAPDPNYLLRAIDGIRVLENLSPDYREAVALTKYVGYTTAEAASWIGISEAAVKARVYRGLLAIRKQLEQEELPA